MLAVFDFDLDRAMPSDVRIEMLVSGGAVDQLLPATVPFALHLTAAAAVVLSGLAAGFFFAYAANVTLALNRLTGETYTTVMQPINESVRNPAFAVVFFGAPAVAALGVVTILLGGDLLTPYGLLFLLGAGVYLVGTLAVTVAVHLPMNDAIAAWSPSAPPEEWAAVRARWTRWNLLRTAAALISFVAFLAATVALLARPPG
jgi:uncharacterized membrane protein